MNIDSLYTVPFDGGFSVAEAPTTPPEDVSGKKDLEKDLAKCVEGISELQSKLYADDRYSLLLVFQAMDAAGKDGTIRAVMSGVNPAGCQVHSFKQPSAEELDHDFVAQLGPRNTCGIGLQQNHADPCVQQRIGNARAHRAATNHGGGLDVVRPHA